MRVGVGLPTTVPGADPGLVVDWARQADTGPFSTLGVLDRLVYDSYEPLVSLGAAAAVTSRIRLATMIAIGPLHQTGTLAKQAASIQALSGGRLTLGLAIGARRDDYDTAGATWTGRGRQLSEQLIRLRTLWDDAAITPAGTSPPCLLVGGLSGEALLRMARHADGYAHNGGPPRAFAGAAARARAAWLDAGRPDAPLVWGQGYVALGDPDAGRDYLLDYYAFTGNLAPRIADGLLTTPRAVADFLRGYADAGCDELLLFPATADPTELDRLAEAVAATPHAAA